jgi:hypothetical protein
VIKPMFDIPPWHWVYGGAYLPNIDHVINDATFETASKNFESWPSYNAVFVMSQTDSPAMTEGGGAASSGGILVDVYRSGFSGTNRLHAPNVTNPWVTTYESAMECGRPVICNTGEWVRHQLRLFSLAPSGESSDLDSLILPGDFIQVNEDRVKRWSNISGHGTYGSWYGSVSSTTIEATLVNGAAVGITQTIGVDEYVGQKVTP